jgi:rhodanese-related sulfurtransferase
VTVRQVGVEEALRLRDEGYRVVDVREPVEWTSGRIAGATHLPLGDLPVRMPIDLPDRDEPLLLYCRSGARSGRASLFLVANGYTNVVNLDALVTDWKSSGGPWEEEAAAETPVAPGQQLPTDRWSAISPRSVSSTTSSPHEPSSPPER